MVRRPRAKVRMRPYFWPRRRVRTRIRGKGRAKTGEGLLVRECLLVKAGQRRTEEIG